MVVHADAVVIPLHAAPRIPDTALVMPNATITGDVRLSDGVSVWPGASLRAELEPIRIGERSNVQDNVSCHVDAGFPLTIGQNVSIGHNAVVHGCTVGDDVLIGMSATVMNGAVIGDGSLIAAGALVMEGQQIPPRSLVAGVPGKVRRELTDDEVDAIRLNGTTYRARIEVYLEAFGRETE